MPNSNPSLVKYRGILKCSQLNTSAFKQCNKSNIFFLPANAPKIHELLEVSATVEPSQHEIVQGIDGTKVSLIGTLNLKFQYVSNDETFYIHSIATQCSFCDYVTLPQKGDTSASSKFSRLEFTPKILVEDIYAHVLSNQCVYHNLTLLICINFY